MNKKSSSYPGKILEEKFLKPMSLSLQRVAGDIHIPESLIDGIIKGKEIISAETALRLGKYFGNGPEFWLTLQMKYDISAAAECLSGEIDGVLQLSDVPDVSLQEALNPLTEQQLLEQKNLRDAWVEENKNRYFMSEALQLLESADFIHPTDTIAAAAVTVCDMELIKKLTKAGYKRWNKPEVGKDAFRSPCQNIIEFLVDNRYDVNTVLPSGASTTTPFCMAIENGHADIVKYLIAAGADVNFRNKQGFTPLHFAADSHSLEVVKALVAAGADINARTIPNRMRDWDPDAMSVLYVMARNGFFEGLKYLIECGAELRHSEEAMTLLHGVCRGGSFPGKIQETTEYLLDLGFDPFQLDRYQESAVGWAVRNNNIPALRSLISRGVPLNRTRDGGFYNGLRSLEIAALNNDTPEDQLIESLELISAHSVPLANTRVLPCAVNSARQPRAKVCRYLLDKGCRVNATWKAVSIPWSGENYFSPLHSICSSGNRKRAEVIALLLASGADVNLKDQDGNTPLAKVFCNHHYEIPEIIALFQQAGADFNAKNNAGRSILQFAKDKYANAEAIRLLKAAGAK